MFSFQGKNPLKLNDNFIYKMLIVCDEIKYNSISQHIIDFANFCIQNDINLIILANNIDNEMKRFIDERVFIVLNNHKICKDFFLKVKTKSICNTYKINVCMFYYLDNNINFRCFFKKNNIILFTILSKDRGHIGSFLIKHSDKIIVFNDRIVEYLLDNNVVEPRKICKICLNIDANYYSLKNVSNGRCSEILKLLGIDNCNKKIIQFFCDYNDLQKCIMMVNVANYLLKKMMADNFVIIMSGYFKNTYRNRLILIKYIKSLKLQEYVKIIDCIYDRPAFYYCSYIVVYLKSDITTITKEAMFMERPLVVSNHCIKEDIVEYKNGFFVDDRSILDTSSKIYDLLKMSQEEYNKMCLFSREYKERHFKNKNSLKDIIDIMNTMMYSYNTEENSNKFFK